MATNNSNNNAEPRSLSEAIERLERVTQSKSQEIKDILGKDYSDLCKAMDDLKPHLAEITDKVTDKLDTAKKSVETKVQENPIATLALAGLAGLFIGWLFGRQR